MLAAAVSVGPSSFCGACVRAALQCVGDNITTPDSYVARRWQTPLPGATGYMPSYQSYATLQGHAQVCGAPPRRGCGGALGRVLTRGLAAVAQVVYASDHKSATVTVVTVTKSPSVKLSYAFNGGCACLDFRFGCPLWQRACAPGVCMGGIYNIGAGVSQSDASKQFASPFSGTLAIVVTGSDGSSLALDDVDFMWNNAAINQPTGDYRNGQKGSIVEFFGWPHADVEQECAILSKLGESDVAHARNARQSRPLSQATWARSFSRPWSSCYLMRR